MTLAGQGEQHVQTWSQEELTSYLRFQLAQLRARNGHHKFEDLCRDFARQNILANILPATGPVAAGGDQGRDFETFHTYLRNTLSVEGVFIGLAPNETVVFACTLQVDNVPSKVMGDLSSICGTGTTVDRVFFFSEAEVTAAKRHDLIKKAREEHDVALEIIDGVALSEGLAQERSTWIAVQHLNVPTAFLPQRTKAPEWYKGQKRRVQGEKWFTGSYGDLMDTRSCIRYAVQDAELKADIEFWISAMTPYMGDDLPQEMRDIACYEVAVARLRGLGDMTPADELTKLYLARALAYSKPSQLEDASVLLMYVQAAWLHRQTRIDKEWIIDYGQRLLRHMEELIEGTVDKGDICELLDTKATLLCGLDLAKVMEESDERGAYAPVPPMSKSRLSELLQHGDVVVRRDIALLDAEGAVDCWMELLGNIDQAPLFPIRQLAEHVSIRAPFFVSLPAWTDLTRQLDLAVERQSGKSARAEAAWNRARSLMQADLSLEALPDLGIARKNWLSGDDFDNAISVMFATGEAFRNLGLLYAAKHYFLAAGAVASAGGEVLHSAVPASLLQASYCDFLAGNWFSFVVLSKYALSSHSEIRGAAEDVHQWDDLKSVVSALAHVRWVSTFMDSSRATSFVDLSLGVSEAGELNGGLPGAPGQESADAVKEQLESGLGQQAFADCGTKRELTWKMQGVSWRVRCENNRTEVMAAERFAAAAQELYTLLSDIDLVLCPSKILVDLSTVRSPNGRAAHVEPRRLRSTKQQERHWRVKVTRDEGPGKLDFRDAHAELAADILTILSEISLLPTDQLERHVQQALNPENFDRLMPHIRYDRAISFIDVNSFDATARKAIKPWGEKGFGEPLIASAMRENNKPGPGFTREEAVIRCERRYESFARMLPRTLLELNRNSNFQSVVARLRGEGWKDWHILQALANQVINYRNSFTEEDLDRVTPEELFAAEAAGALPVPADLVTEDSLRTHLSFSFAATLKTWGLFPHGELIPEDYLAVLENRFGYWVVDARHEDPFAASDASDV
ncbi:hypothetical protein ACFQ9J_27960 [Streptomyces sp. NPDC056529]|uniref:hypothetical protein n=1 Tax=Streptomyces sp. NPDC056529 TaxID=3345855 RepID=UPI0036AE2035